MVARSRRAGKAGFRPEPLRGWAALFLGCAGLWILLAGTAAVAEDEANEAFPMEIGEGKSGSDLIPLEEVEPRFQDMVRRLLEDHTLYVNAAPTVFRSDKFTYEFLFEHLSFATAVVRQQKGSKYRVEDLGDGYFRGGDSAGVVGIFRVVYASRNARAYYGEGSYNGPLVPKTPGKFMLIAFYEEREDEQGPYMVNKIYAFLDIDSFFFASFARLIQIFMPGVVNNKMSTLFASGRVVAEMISADPEEVYQLAVTSGEVRPQELEDYRAAFLDGSRPSHTSGADQARRD